MKVRELLIKVYMKEDRELLKIFVILVFFAIRVYI